jgi:copper chaperone
MSKRIYNVPDVHCDHCVAAINRELGQIDGVSDIEVDLQAKTVTVEAERNVTDARIAEGLYEAGFDLAKA